MNSQVTSANANGVGLRTSEAPFAAAHGYAAPKRTRAERKAARRAEWKRQEEAAAAYRKAHPILSGAIKIVDYVPPGSKRHTGKVSDGGGL